VPRPDLAATLQTDDACTDCHTGKSAAWAAAAIEDWYGPERKGFQNFGPAFHAAWTGAPDAAARLAAVAADKDTPAFARASAMQELEAYPSRETAALVREGLADPDPEVRLGALDMLQTLPAPQLWPLVSRLLSDPVRGVRIRAAYLLSGIPAGQLTAEDRNRLGRAGEEFIAAQRLNADRPESRAMLGTFYVRRGQMAEAEAEYKAALRLSPAFAPAAANLADLYRQLGREEDAEELLREAIETSPQDGGLHHALGLALVRLKRPDEAIEELHRATELAPENARYAYVYAVGLETAGRRPEAMTVLKENLARHPGDRDTLGALIGFSRDQGDDAETLQYAERLAEITPDDRALAQLIEALRRKIPEQSNP
jgi:tetratricopeptide (TPR) repeat protein